MIAARRRRNNELWGLGPVNRLIMPPFLEVIQLRFNFAPLDAKGFLNIKTEEKDFRLADITF